MKLPQWLALALLLVGYSASSIQARANETPYDINLAPVAQITYEPFSGLPSRERLSISLARSDLAASDLATAIEQNRGRRLRLRIRTANSTGFFAVNGAQKLPVQISRLGNSRGFGSANNEVYQDLVIGNNLRSQRFDFRLSIPASIFAEPGAFSLPLNVELVDLTSNAVIADSNLEIQAVVGVRLQTNIAGANTNRNVNSRFAMVNFGVLESGESQQVSLQIRGNSSADITLTSENDGKLRHNDDSELFVDYSVNVDGEASSLESPLNMIRAVDKTIRGSAYPVKIIIGDVEGSFAGPYRDVITVEVRPTID